MKYKRFLWLSFGVCGSVLAVILLCNVGVIWNAGGRTYDKIEDIPNAEMGLVLGTSPITPQGSHNVSFDNRIKAANELYRRGKVKKLVVSGGDYSSTEKFGCDEPKAMKDSLMAHGVRPEDIFLDYDGTTTIRSLAKLKSYYGNKDTVTIISQGYHNLRALAMADRLGLPAIAFNAAVPENISHEIKNCAREALARVKMLYSFFFPTPEWPLTGPQQFDHQMQD